MFFSSNVAEMEAERLSGVLGIPSTKKMGKYLGHHIAVDGKNRERHQELLGKVHKRIEGWKLKCLSRAARLTLAQSVVGSLPIFNMQVERLPCWVHRELDRAMRKCVWGNVEGRKGIYLLDWDTLCQPNELGGANLKSAKDMNRTLMAKLAWKLLSQTEQAWSKVLSSKYKVEIGDGIHFKSKSLSSQVWKGIIWGAGLLRKGLVGRLQWQ